MIGGVDWILPVHAPEQAIESICHLVRTQFWPGAVIEDATTGEQILLPAEPPSGLSPGCTEVLLYRDRQAAEEWRRCGAVAGWENTMIHLIADENAVTVVVDDPRSAEMRKLLDAIIELVRNEIFQVEAIA